MAYFTLPPLRPAGRPSPVVNVHLPPVKVPARQTPAPSSTATALYHPIRSPSKNASSSPMTNPVFLPPLNLSGKKTAKFNVLPPLGTALKQTEVTQETFYLQVSNPAIQ